jgi:hypothetical protein
MRLLFHPGYGDVTLPIFVAACSTPFATSHTLNSYDLKSFELGIHTSSVSILVRKKLPLPIIGHELGS